MNPTEIIATGDALSKLGAFGLLCVAVIVLGLLCYRLWRDGKADSKEAAATYVSLLREQFSDANRRKDLFDDLGKSLDGTGQATRDLRQEFANLRQELAAFRADMQRARP